MRRATAAVLTLPIIFALAGCASDVESATAEPEVVTVEPEDVEPEDTEPEKVQAEESTAAGTRSDPIPIGEVVAFRDGARTFEVSVGVTDFDAADAIKDELMARGQHFEPPAPGTTYALAPVTVTYFGEDSISAHWEVDLNFVTADGHAQWSGADFPIPDGMGGKDWLHDGDTVTGNYIFLVATDEIAGSVYAVEVRGSGEEVFFSTGH